MNKLALILYLILLMPLEKIHSQEIRTISKNEVFELVAKNNASIKISEQEYYQAKADYRQTNGVLLPYISVSHTGIATTNPLMAFGSKLNQEILTNSDFDPILLNNPNQIKNFATKIEVLQPIINMDGIYQRRAAKNKMEAQEFQIERTKDYMAFEVEKAYMQLQLSYKAVDVLNKALEAALANRSLAENSFKQGFLQKTDVLAVEVRVTEVQNQLQNAKSNIKNSSEYLSFLINNTDLVQYKPTDSLAISVLAIKESSMVSEQRADIKAMKLASNAYQTMHKADKLAFLPNLNAFGSYELYDNKIFQTDASGYLIGAQLSWNIFEGSKRFGKIQKSKAEYEKSRLQYEQYISQSNLEFNKAKRMLFDAENKLKLTKLALDQSKESMRIRTNRFKQGLEKTSDLLIVETQYSQKQLEYYQTIFEYNYAQSYLNFLMK
ncbi:MAG: TolC family protein [Flavobacteriaceae bacterium]|nr:TolC family protein [Flavobacteriaceae bacterium]